LGSAVSSHSWVRGEAPAAKRLSCILEAPDCLSSNLLGAKFVGEHGSLDPLKRPRPADVVVRTLDLRLRRSLSGDNIGQVVHTHVPLSPSSIIWYWSRAV